MKITAINKDKAQIQFYGPIMEGFFDDEKCFDEAKIAKVFADINPKADLEILLNSPGGNVDSALAINGLLNNHQGNITIKVTGLAASAATLITSLSKAKTVITQGSLMMIHNPMTTVMGNSHDLEKQADVLDKCAESMRAIYAKKTGLDENRIKNLMDEETWLTAQEAVELGFADEIDESEPVTALIKPNHILAIAGHEWDLKDLPLPKQELLMSKKEDPAKTEPEVKAEIKQEPMTAQLLASNHPELINQIVNDAVSKERDRMKALLDIDNGSNHDLVMKAMFDEPRSAEAVAIETLKAQKAQQQQIKNSIQDDAENLADVVEGDAEGALPIQNNAEHDSLVSSVHANLKKLNGYN